jgi:hypothetical protein
MNVSAALELLLSIIVIWTIGLLPAFIARHAWKRAPLKPSMAAWIAGVWCFLLFIADTVLAKAADPSAIVNGFVWFLVFLVSRWIMTHGYKQQLLAKLQTALTEVGDDDERRTQIADRLAALKKTKLS